MYLLKPSTERLRKRTNGAFKRMCIRLYQSILRCLLKNYRHYAISDTISLDGGRIKIIHEFRDLKFENELVRNGIDVHPHLLSREMSFAHSKGNCTGCFKYFKWKDLKSIYIDDKELFIKHDDSLSINGNVTGKIKSSSSEDIIIRSITELKTVKKRTAGSDYTKKIEIEFVPQNKRPNNVFFRGDWIHEREKPQNKTEVLSQSEVEQRIAKRGFEIDATF